MNKYLEFIEAIESCGYYYANLATEPNPLEGLKKFTDTFTQKYVSDAVRRKPRWGSVVRDVDYGASEVLLHSESSFGPSWPELVTFYCLVPPKEGGQTVLCDGALLYEKLPREVRDFFQVNPIRYDLEIPLGKKGTKKRPWRFDVSGAGNAIIDWERGVLNMTQIRAAICESRFPGKLSFCNHLLVSLESEPQLLRRSLVDGTPIPESILTQVSQMAISLQCPIDWKAGDLLVLDNRRLMHGRLPYPSGDPRDIVQVQTEIASFPYGLTTRRRTYEEPRRLSYMNQSP